MGSDNCHGVQSASCIPILEEMPGERIPNLALKSHEALDSERFLKIEGLIAAPRSEKGKAAASPIEPGGLGKSRRVGPERMLDVATVSITFSPITFGDPKTQKTSAANLVYSLPQ